jgi:hypothetical protein
LTGPGGVGDLGSGSARAPGPGPDRLADLLGPALPRFVAPPPHMTAFTPWAPGLLSPGDGGACPPGAAVAGGGGGGLDLQDMGGAIEGWMRRVVRRAASALEAGNSGGGAAAAVPAAGQGAAAAKANVGVRAMALGSGGLGDLIELVDAFEVGDESSVGEDASAEAGGGRPGTSAWNVGGAATGELRGRRQGRGV